MKTFSTKKTFLIAAATEFLSFFLIVVNTRAYTKGLYFWTFVTDSFFITQTFFVAKWMVEVKQAAGSGRVFRLPVRRHAGKPLRDLADQTSLRRMTVRVS